MNCTEMKELALLVRDEKAFIDITIQDVAKIVRKDKQHLASTFECSSINRLLRFDPYFIGTG